MEVSSPAPRSSIKDTIETSTSLAVFEICDLSSRVALAASMMFAGINALLITDKRGEISKERVVIILASLLGTYLSYNISMLLDNFKHICKYPRQYFDHESLRNDLLKHTFLSNWLIDIALQSICKIKKSKLNIIPGEINACFLFT